jgi:hypothetical protein
MFPSILDDETFYAGAKTALQNDATYLGKTSRFLNPL